ncbi:uncharacterized protein LOC6568882 [Drosophila grimshawi]|uniref:GH22766 n=1 Tax=Drosophila grimshawi TaxID=7222 RepID=B4JWC3_DROGR|nr:uncharacterized protein LOC6568882 [Drosophila grimshawi]EDV98261.1 GH22766 [Drosophila grimshawi]
MFNAGYQVDYVDPYVDPYIDPFYPPPVEVIEVVPPQPVFCEQPAVIVTQPQTVYVEQNNGPSEADVACCLALTACCVLEDGCVIS